MIKTYLFKSTNSINKNIFIEIMKNLDETSEVTFIDNNLGFVKADERMYEKIDSQTRSIADVCKGVFTFLAAHQESNFMVILLNDATKFFRNQIVFPSDVIMKQLSFGDYKSYPYLKEMFSSPDYTLMKTVGTYLRCGLDALHAAKLLGVHRNTFNNRLDSFASITGLDIRDYHNALLLELYFQLIA